jgi:hypothetical protein
MTLFFFLCVDLDPDDVRSKCSLSLRLLNRSRPPALEDNDTQNYTLKFKHVLLMDLFYKEPELKSTRV